MPRDETADRTWSTQVRSTWDKRAADWDLAAEGHALGADRTADIARVKRKLAVGSGSKRESVLKTLDTLGLRDFFPVIVAAEDTARGKPAPDVFLLAAERLGVAPSRCLVFEDAELGIQAAEAAGMKWVKVV